MHRRIAAAVLAALVLAPAAARADTIVYRRGGDIWIVQPDGSGERRVAQGTFAWPSESDAGAIAAVDAAGAIHRLTQKGAEIGAPLPTAATLATEDAPAEPPTHVRVSPDGSRIAYDGLINDEATTLWTPFAATALDLPAQNAGQEELEAPSWIGSDRLVLSRDVAALGTGESTLALYTAGDGDDSAADWFSDARADWASGFEAAVSRSGRRLAVLADDSAEFGGFPQRVELRVYDVDAPGGNAQVRCDIALPAEETVEHTSPSFSPDGNRLAWAQADGIHVATIGGACVAKEALIAAAGAWEPYWSPADDASPPKANPGGGSRLTLRLTVASRPKHVFTRGLGARVACSAACALHVTLKLDRATAFKAGIPRQVAATSRTLTKAGNAKLHLRLRPKAERALRKLPSVRLVLRVSAPGATPVSHVLRAG